MKVVISTGMDDFSLSDAVVTALIERGHQPSIDFLDLIQNNFILASGEDENEYCGGPYLSDKERADPLLIEVIESLGVELSSGSPDTNLKIVTIPDGIEWSLSIPDMGAESIHEKHRIWS